MTKRYIKPALSFDGFTGFINDSLMQSERRTMANSNNSTSSSDFLSPPVVIKENSFYPDSKQPTESFLYPAEYEGHLEGVVISRDDIQKRTIEIAKQISLDYKGRRPYLICVLKGSCMVRYFGFNLLDSNTF